jgi:hypothetical protein
MKIRWTRGSVRLRITPAELEALTHSQVVTETFRLPGAGAWSAEIHPHGGQPSLDIVGGKLRLWLTLPEVARLAEPQREGVYFETSDQPPLRYYIEKDFPCVHPRTAERQEPVTETFMPDAAFLRRKQAE